MIMGTGERKSKEAPEPAQPNYTQALETVERGFYPLFYKKLIQNPTMPVKRERIKVLMPVPSQKAAENLAKPAFWPVNTGMNAPVTASIHANANTPDPAHWAQLMARLAQNRDRDAFIDLFNHFAPRLKSYLMKNGARPDQAEELAQETMIAVWDRAGSYDPGQANVSTWIFTIARNKRIDALRKFSRPDPDPSDVMMTMNEPAAPGQHLEQQEESARIADAIKSLPHEQRELVYKSFFEGKPHADIAAETKLPLGTVKSRIRLALDRLRRDINGDDFGR